MDTKQKMGGRRSKRLILKRKNEKMLQDGIFSEQAHNDTSHKQGKYNLDYYE